MCLKRDCLTFTSLQQALKQYFPIPKPKIVLYKDYKYFQNDGFRTELDNKILTLDIGNIDYHYFLSIFIDISSEHAPIKIIRANQGKFMKKDLHKAIMKRSRLLNKFLRDRRDVPKRIQKAKKSLCNPLEKSQKKTILQILMTFSFR